MGIQSILLFVSAPVISITKTIEKIMINFPKHDKLKLAQKRKQIQSQNLFERVCLTSIFW